MRRFAIIVCSLLLLLPAACTHDIFFPLKGLEPVLCVQSILTPEEPGIVHIAVSEGQLLRPLPDTAQVCLYVNGQLEFQADTMYVSDNIQHYPVRLSFHSGDEIQLTVDQGDFHARGRCIIPPEARILQTDTVSVPEPFSNHARQYTIGLHLPYSSSEEGYYRVLNAHARVQVTDGATGPLVMDTLLRRHIQPDGDSPVFTDDTQQALVEIGEKMGFDYPFNPVFSSNAIPQEEVALVYSVPQHKTFRYIRNERYSNYPYASSPIVHNAIQIPLATMDRNTFLFYRSLSAGSGNLLREPAQSISNIEGGIGYFGVLQITYAEIQLEDFQL